MSYSLNTEIKKNRSISKSLYSSIDESEDFFIFDIKLISKKKKFKKIRKIKNSKNDLLIDVFDKVLFDKYLLLELSFININKPFINHSVSINLNKKHIIFNDNMIYLEIDRESDYLKCYYNLEVNN